MASYRIFRHSKGTLGLCRAVCLRAVCLVRMVHRSTFSFHDRIDALPPMPAIPLAIGSSDILVVAASCQGLLWFLDSSLDIPPRGWARFAIWGFVLALDSAPGTCRLNLCSTLWARVCVCTDYEAIFDAKLFATMPCGMYGSISNGATGAGVAIGALVYSIFLLRIAGVGSISACVCAFCAFLALLQYVPPQLGFWGSFVAASLVPRGDGRSLRGLPLSRPVAAPCAAVRAGKDVQRSPFACAAFVADSCHTLACRPGLLLFARACSSGSSLSAAAAGMRGTSSNHALYDCMPCICAAPLCVLSTQLWRMPWYLFFRGI